MNYKKIDDTSFALFKEPPGLGYFIFKSSAKTSSPELVGVNNIVAIEDLCLSREKEKEKKNRARKQFHANSFEKRPLVMKNKKNFPFHFHFFFFFIRERGKTKKELGKSPRLGRQRFVGCRHVQNADGNQLLPLYIHQDTNIS